MGLFLTIVLAGVVIKYFDEIVTLLYTAGALLFVGVRGFAEARREMKQEAAAKAPKDAQPPKKGFWTWKKLAFIALALFILAVH